MPFGDRTSRWARIGCGALLLGFVLAQAVPVTRTNPPVTTEPGAPVEVAALLRRACYDCHSHETRWPWYAHVAPASWLLAHDVDEGRQKLDFSIWDAVAAGRKTKRLKQSAEEVTSGEMPPWYYRLMHPEARLDATERAALSAWALGEAAHSEKR